MRRLMFGICVESENVRWFASLCKRETGQPASPLLSPSLAAAKDRALLATRRVKRSQAEPPCCAPCCAPCCGSAMLRFACGHRLYKLWKPLGVESVLLELLARCKVPDGVDLSSATLVGRLDKDSDGLMLLTPDEALARRLLQTYDGTQQQRYTGSTLSKVYRVRTNYPMPDAQLDELRSGVAITTRARRRGGGKRTQRTLPCDVERDTSAPRGKVLFVTLREGRNRQLRKMIGGLGHVVASLRRVAFGSVTLQGLDGPGAVAALSDAECEALLAPLHGQCGGAIDAPTASADEDVDVNVKEHAVRCEPQRDTYIDPDTGYSVFSAAYLRQRPCCGNGCRHCPWGHMNVPAHRRKERPASADSTKRV